MLQCCSEPIQNTKLKNGVLKLKNILKRNTYEQTPIVTQFTRHDADFDVLNFKNSFKGILSEW